MIRNATTSDLPKILNLMRRFHPKTPYVGIEMDVLSVSQVLGQCINSALGFAVVAEHDGNIDGIMMAAAQPLWFSKKRQATDFLTHAERPGDGAKMIRRFIKWAWSVPNVAEVTLAQSSGIDVERTAKLYTRAGLVRVGNIFTAVRESAVAEEAA